MKTRLIPFFTALIALLLAATPATASEAALEGAEPGEWTMDYAAALELSEEKDLPLLLNFTGSDWCSWCKLMDNQVFAEEEWKTWADDNLVLVTLDFPRDDSIVPEKYRDRNQSLAEQFGVRGYPTYVLLDSDGETVVAQLGAGREKTPESFIDEIEEALILSPSNIEAKIAELGEEKGAELQAALDRRDKTVEELEAWIETEPEQTPENQAKFEKYLESIQEANETIQSFFASAESA